MTERLARHITLLIIAAGSILLFLVVGFLALGFSWDSLSRQGSELPVGFVVMLIAFLLLGVLIILGAFFKLPLHILTAVALLFLIASLFSAPVLDYDASEASFVLLFLAPLIFYYVVRIVGRRRTPK